MFVGVQRVGEGTPSVGERELAILGSFNLTIIFERIHRRFRPSGSIFNLQETNPSVRTILIP